MKKIDFIICLLIMMNFFSTEIYAQTVTHDDLQLQSYFSQCSYHDQELSTDNEFNSHQIFNQESKSILFSIEPFMYIPYYFVFSSKEIYGESTMYANSWNFGAGSLVSLYAGSLKVSAGIDYSTKNYYRSNYSSNSLTDKIRYMNTVLQISYKPFARFSPFIGFVTKRPLQYNNQKNIQLQRELRDSLGLPQTTTIIVYDTLSPWGWYWKTVENIPEIHVKNKISAMRMGVNLRKNDIKKFNANFQVFIDYSFKHDAYFSWRVPVSMSRFMLGISLNMELYLNKNYKNFVYNFHIEQ